MGVDDRQAGGGAGCGLLGQGALHPPRVIGGVDASVDFHALGGAPTREGLNHVVGAAGSQEGAGEADAERVERVVADFGDRNTEAEKVAEVSVDR